MKSLPFALALSAAVVGSADAACTQSDGVGKDAGEHFTFSGLKK
jgi:hypothetical protein